MKRTVVFVLVAVAVSCAVGWMMHDVVSINRGESYAGGRLIDATGPIVFEEDDDLEVLGVRLVALAAGEKFTEEQIEQMKDLLAGLFWAIGFNSWLCDELSFDLEKLEAKWHNEN